ncbi:MAG TPA: hypothetical protein PLH64_00105 [Anaerolineaceae bacterium]|nr:hypothetical protein [Anaerolineaceae bacterium]
MLTGIKSVIASEAWRSAVVLVGRDWKHCDHHYAKASMCFQSAITPIIRNEQALLTKSPSTAN